MNGDSAIRQLRMLAIELVLGMDVGSDRLVRAGLDALLAGADSPALRLLAGLTRAEEPEARQLFRRAVDELVVTRTLPALSDDPIALRWEMVRWWAQLIADGDLDPGVGGNLIWQHGWSRLGHPEALQPLVAATCQYDDHASSYAIWDTDRHAATAALAEEIVHGARELLGRGRSRPDE